MVREYHFLLRGHHLNALYLCAILKRGNEVIKDVRKYNSKQQAEKAASIFSKIINSFCRIKLVAGEDNICKGDECENKSSACFEKTHCNYDRKCLELWKLKENQIYSSDEILNSIKNASKKCIIFLKKDDIYKKYF